MADMTTNQIIQYYANLLILEYIGQPRAYATIQTWVTPIVMDQLPMQVNNGFGLETAVGVQLDVLGKYQAVTRTGVNFNGNPIVLDDSDFRSLIKMAIIRNTSGSSLYDIQNILHTYFPNQIFVYDNANMQLSYLITSTAGSQNLAEMFVVQGLLPKPMGVALTSVIFLPTIDIFGFRTYFIPGNRVFPFNTYADYHMDWPWLTYQDAINL